MVTVSLVTIASVSPFFGIYHNKDSSSPGCSVYRSDHLISTAHWGFCLPVSIPTISTSPCVFLLSLGLECDTVIHRRNGSYALIEIKLGGEELINNGASNLLELANKINTDKMQLPSFMAVVVGVGEYAYQRKDGVFVIPIGCLKD